MLVSKVQTSHRSVYIGITHQQNPPLQHAQTFRPIYVWTSTPQIPFSYGPVYLPWIPGVCLSATAGHFSPGSISAARAQLRTVGLFEPENHPVASGPVRPPWAWLSWDYLWGRVWVYECGASQNFYSINMTRNRSPQSHFQTVILLWIYWTSRKNRLNIKFCKPTSEPLRMLEVYHEAGSLKIWEQPLGV